MSANQENTNSNLSQYIIQPVFDVGILNGQNFLEWFQLLRLVLKFEKKSYILELPPPNLPARDAYESAQVAYDKYQRGSISVAYLMLASMTPELRREHEELTAWEIMNSLKTMFGQQLRQEKFETLRSLHACMMQEGTPVKVHFKRIKGHIDRLAQLGYPLGQELGVDMVLNSLSKSYGNFVLNYYKKGLNVSLFKLLGMLKSFEKQNYTMLEKAKAALMIKTQRGIRKKSDVKVMTRKGKAKTGCSSRTKKNEGKLPLDSASIKEMIQFLRQRRRML